MITTDKQPSLNGNFTIPSNMKQATSEPDKDRHFQTGIQNIPTGAPESPSDNKQIYPQCSIFLKYKFI